MVVAVKSKGTGFRGLANYLEKGSAGKPKPGRIEWIEARNLSTPDPSTAARIMRATANHNDRVADAKAKPVEHLSISWEPTDKPSKEQMIEVADRVLRAAGLDRSQALIVAHNDTQHAHVHLFINRVDPETFKVVSDSHDYLAIEAVLRKAEREFGWKETPGHHWRFPDQGRPQPDQRPSKIERRQIEEGKRPFADLVRDAARQDFREAADWGDLERRLAEKGLRLEPVGKVGFVVSDGQEKCKASEIDRGAGRGALEKRFGSYEQRNDRAALDRASQQDGRTRPDRGGDSRRPNLTGDGRDERRLDPDGPRPGGDQPRDGRDRTPDAGDRHETDVRGGGAGPDRRDAGRGDERVRDEVPAWWRELSRVEQQPPSLNAALERLERFDAVTVRLEQAEAEAAKLVKAVAKIEAKERWGATVKADTIRQLGKVYRDPEKAFERIKAEIDAHGSGRATGKLERQPEAFGKLRGGRVAGGILTKRPFTIIANAERRAAKSQVADVARELRKYVGAERAVQAAAAGKPDLVRQRDQAQASVASLRAERGEGERWERVRDVERAAKAATPKERTSLSPERRQALAQIEAEQRARYQKHNVQRSQQQAPTNKAQERAQAPARAPTRGRGGPVPER